MEYNYFIYEKPECSLIVNKMPIWFKEEECEVNEDNGYVILHSQNDYDEIWGSNSKFEIKWDKIDRTDLFYYKEVENSIETYNAIGIVVTNKERDWLMSHEYTSWFGHRRKMIRKRYYVEKVIHGIFYCEVTERLFNLHTSIIESMYENFKPYIIKSYSSIECH